MRGLVNIPLHIHPVEAALLRVNLYPAEREDRQPAILITLIILNVAITIGYAREVSP
jgi:hypothetical protein